MLPDSMKHFAKTEDKKKESFSVFELMESTFSFTQDRLTEVMIEHYKPDILIEIPRETCDTFEFYKAKELLEIGAKAFRNSKER